MGWGYDYDCSPEGDIFLKITSRQQLITNDMVFLLSKGDPMNFKHPIITIINPKRIFISLLLCSLLINSSSYATATYVDNGGDGYTESVRTTSLAPSIILGAIALAGIIAVAVQNTSGHAHCHAHD